MERYSCWLTYLAEGSVEREGVSVGDVGWATQSLQGKHHPAPALRQKDCLQGFLEISLQGCPTIKLQKL